MPPEQPPSTGDIALVSGSFTGNPFVDIDLLLDATVEVDGMLENHTFPSNATDDPFFQEIMRTGIRLRQALQPTSSIILVDSSREMYDNTVWSTWKE